jgi:membrane protease YdiL (CAAX protease family)
MSHDSGAGRPPCRRRETVVLGIVFATFFSAWTGWAWMLAAIPSLSHTSPLIRVGVRVALWIGPAVVYTRRVERRSLADALGLRNRALRGVVWGLAVGAVLAVTSALIYGRVLGRTGTFPLDWNTWLNPILSAPLAEEILFRGILFRRLAVLGGLAPALLISSVLFAAIHVPYWWLAHAMPPIRMAGQLVQLALFGALLGWLYHRTQSFWTPLLVHAINNLVSLCWPS